MLLCISVHHTLMLIVPVIDYFVLLSQIGLQGHIKEEMHTNIN